MAAIMMALVTLTSCDEDEDPSDDPDEIENGNNGGVAGKRIKTQLQTTGPMEGSIRVEWTYNSDGSIKRQDLYDASSKLVSYEIWTSNSDGTIAKDEMYDSNNNLLQYMNYSYDANKKPLKGQGEMYSGSVAVTWTYDYTYQNGRKIRQVMKVGDLTNDYEFIYDSQGRCTGSTETTSYSGQFIGGRKFTRTYNTDGTIQKVTYPYSSTDNTTVIQTFTWENRNTKMNYADFSLW